MDFSFCGIDVSTYGLHYAPKPKNIFVWDSDYKTHTLEADSYDGGYYFGSTVKPKVFELECYFEELTPLQVKQIQSLFHRGKTGELIFSDRPFLVYIATATKWVRPEMYATVSGIITIHLTAFYPFARIWDYSVSNYNTYGAEYIDLVKGSTGLMLTGETPSNVVSTTPALTLETAFLMYNPGDERADPIIRIAGAVGTGVHIYNSATNQTCLIKGITKALTTDVGKWLEIDSLSGKVYITNGTTSVMSFLYHDKGFIQLAGSAPIRRDIAFTYTGNTVTSTATFSVDDVGKYIMIASTWRKIVSLLSTNSVTVDYTHGTPGSGTSNVVSMNYITITPVTTMDITKLEFHYNPTFK